MIRIFSILLLILAITAGCDKSTDDQKSLKSELLGKWIHTEHYFSIGTEGDWHQAEPAGQTIEFKKNGSFKSAVNFGPDFRKFEIIDSNTIRFKPASTPNGYVQMKVSINLKEGILELSPTDPICIEGCANRFRRP